MESRLDEFTQYPYEKQDIYAWLLELGSVGKGIGDKLDDRHEMWQRIVDNPSYGPYWKDVAVDQWFDKPERLVPALHIHGFWDQEDIYDAPAAYAAPEKHDKDNDLNFFAAGPWYHDQQFDEGNHLGEIIFDQNTSKRFREEVLAPFFRRYLHGDSDVTIAPVTVFESGNNRWREFDQWPPAGKNVRVYLQDSGELTFERPATV